MTYVIERTRQNGLRHFLKKAYGHKKAFQSRDITNIRLLVPRLSRGRRNPAPRRHKPTERTNMANPYLSLQARMGVLGCKARTINSELLMIIISRTYNIPYDEGDDELTMLMRMDEVRGKTNKEIKTYIRNVVVPNIRKDWDGLKDYWNETQLQRYE